MLKKSTSAVLKKLRAAMSDLKYTKEEIGGYIIPSNDAHSSSYVAPCDDRKGYICGFNAGYAPLLVTQKDACLWTDGRYYDQALNAVDENWKVMKFNDRKFPGPAEWVIQNMAPGSKLGVDPTVFTSKHWRIISNKITRSNITLYPIKQNLVDVIWENRPARPNNPIIPHQKCYSGKKIKQKLIEIKRMMKRKNVTMIVLFYLDEIAWTLNLRGSDIPYNPFFFSYMFIEERGFTLFTWVSKFTAEVRQHFEEEAPFRYYIEKYENVYENLKQKSLMTDGLVWCSPQINFALASMIPEEKLLLQPNPIAPSKSVKTPNEILGMRECSIRDGAAVCSLFHWLETNVPSGNVTELKATAQYDILRQAQKDYIGPCSETTSAAGKNTAIKHYIATPASDQVIGKNDIYLFDGGSHYIMGTTDCTRTMHFGTPTDLQRDIYTRVLQGLICTSRVIFPNRTKGTGLDTFARKSLWAAGLDYDHRTGHGVGAYLSVHEGPVNISPYYSTHDPGFNPGMFITCNPTTFIKGEFGIHMENLLLTVIVEAPYQYEDVFLGFEPITLVPFQKKLMKVDMLSQADVNWINEYNIRIRKRVIPVLKKMNYLDVIKWLIEQTEHIKK